MTAQEPAGTRLVDGISAPKLLEGLGRLYQLVMLLDRDRRIAWMSNDFDALCGAEFHIGRDVRSMLPELPKLPKPEQVFTLRSQLRQQGFLSAVRVDVNDRLGVALPVEVSILPVLGDDESPFFVVIARRLDAEEAPPPPLDSAMQPILECAPDAILAIDDRGFVTYANPAIERLLGLLPEQVIDRPVAMLLSNASDLDRLVSSLGPGEGILDEDLTLHRRDGAEVRASVSASTLRGDDVRGRVLILRDVTQRRRVEAELEHKNAELEHCVHALAHDLRSPLVALLGFSKLLRQDYGATLDDTGTHFLDRIEQAGRTMEDLIHDLLELSRIGRGGERRHLVDPRPILQQLAAEFKPRLDAGGITLDLPESPPPVFCDRTRLYQVLCNLIGNALDHMGACDTPRIEVRVYDDVGAHHITVRDRGRGIAREHHGRIFDVFQSLGPRSDGSRGSGIGLAVVRKIAETHGGRAWVESEPGHGAAFHVTLPIH